MSGVAQGFTAIIAVIALGFFLAHRRFLTYDSQVMLARLAFFVASPALLLTVMADADITGVFSENLLATVIAVAVVASVYLLFDRFVGRRRGAERVIGTQCAMYVNAGNLGLPIAVYVLGDAALAAPVLMLQLLVLQPIAMALLDRLTAPAGFSAWALLRRTASNPITLGALCGLLLALSGITLPELVRAPLDLVAAMAVPAMLMAYGVSLRLGPRPGTGVPLGEMAFIVGLKLLLQPTVAFLAGRFLLGMDGHALLAVTVLAALPTAQNIFVHASRYGQGVTLARDVIAVTTVGSVPVIAVIAALLG